MLAAIRAIDHYLPETVVTNDQLAARSDHWTAEQIADKTGIVERRIARPDECATDLAVQAAARLFDSGACSAGEIDYLLLCTQSPDFFLPSSACLLQQRLGLRKSIGAADINLGCSGYVSGLSLAKGLIETRQASNVLLLTSDTYSKYMKPDDLSVRSLFGDGAAATLVQAVDPDPSGEPFLGPFCFGTDGRGAEHLIVRRGTLTMNGPAVFAFALERVPRLVLDLLERAQMAIDDVRWFVFHQANQFMLEHLRRKIAIPARQFIVSLSRCGNTVSSTIPIALHDALQQGKLKHGDRLLLAGFGVGFSWSGALVRWHG